MSSFTVGPFKSYNADAAVDAYILVFKTSAGGVSPIATAASDVAIGVTVAPAAINTAVTVRLLNGGGTAYMKAGNPIAVNAAVRQLATGTIDDTGTTPVVGYAEAAAAAAGDIIEVRLHHVPA